MFLKRSAIVLAIPVMALLTSCGPDLSVTLTLEDPELRTPEDTLSPSIVFRNEGRRTLYLPTAWIQPGGNLELVMYRRSRGYPAMHALKDPDRPPANPDPAPGENPGENPAEISDDPGPRYGYRDPQIVKLQPGETYRHPIWEVEAEAIRHADPDDPQIGLWNVRAFFTGRYDPENLNRLQPHVRQHILKGPPATARSNPVTVLIAGRSEP